MSRTVRVGVCKCGARILTGLDADHMAILVTLDAQPVDNLGEALALLQGRRSYDLRPTTGYRSHGRVLEERNAWRISNPRIRPWPVHAEHRCDQPLPAAAVEPTPAHATTSDRLIQGAPF